MTADRSAAAPARGGEVLLHVEEDGTGDVTGPPGLAPAASRIEIPAHVHDAEPAVGDVFDEPVCGDERPHSYFAWSPFIIGDSTFL
jgi:hypothetical protein